MNYTADSFRDEDMKVDLKDKKCIVTGASSGIGKGVVKYLLREGAYVFGISLEREAPDFLNEHYYPCCSDLSQPGEVLSTFQKAQSLFGEIDLYIANAGQARYGLSQSLLKSEMELLVNLNFLAVVEAFNLMKTSHPESPFSFLAISSVMADWPLPGYAFYSATKASIATYLKGVRHELRKGQKTHIVYPVATKTNFFSISGQTHQSWMLQTPEHVARAILKGLKKGKKHIYPSRLFYIAYKIAPFALNLYIQREIKLLESKEAELESLQRWGPSC